MAGQSATQYSLAGNAKGSTGERRRTLLVPRKIKHQKHTISIQFVPRDIMGGSCSTRIAPMQRRYQPPPRGPSGSAARDPHSVLGFA
eukprot:1417015-Rhodomonas_salina.2